ncbi:ATP-dependent DNA ligase (plasmid) [Nocardia sp. CA-084685]|uniref:ATP-dependent DNA ligase n=1 Tax=Nocardia sp. CA-084685 TaxID=3239970 RepID=UPI003D9682A8
MSVPRPMLASAGPVPDDDATIAVEWKWDGCRAITALGGGVCRIISRNGNNLTSAFPELSHALLASTAGRDMILDGEIVAPDAAGRPRFTRVQRRLNVIRPSAALVAEVPTQLYLFDLLGLDGVNLMRCPYQERREQLMALDLPGPALMVPPHFVGVPVSRMLQAAQDNAIEGVVVKALRSLYYPGRRTKYWRKISLFKTAEVIVVGWLPSRSSGLRGLFGSLLLGAYDNSDRLMLVGGVGVGFSDAARRALQRQLDELVIADCPLDVPAPRSIASEARWVTPHVIGEVQYKELTAGGLRHPTWRGQRFDRSTVEITVPKSDH